MGSQDPTTRGAAGRATPGQDPPPLVGLAFRRFTQAQARAGEPAAFVAGSLIGHAEHHSLNRAVRLVDELVANAVTHARSDVEVTVRASELALRVEVRDFSAVVPTRRRPDRDQASGSGMWNLERLAARWGCEPVADGKVVWFELDPRGRRGPSPPGRGPLGGVRRSPAGGG